jgi:hypothetical protein
MNLFMKPTEDQVRVVLDLKRTKRTEQRTKRGYRREFQRSSSLERLKDDNETGCRRKKKSLGRCRERDKEEKMREGREMRGWWWVVYFGVFSSFFCVFLSEWK